MKMVATLLEALGVMLACAALAVLLVRGLTWIFVTRKRVLRRLLDPDYCFPSLGPVDPPHEFKPYEGISVCGRCGGGRKHAIHTGGPWPLPVKGSRRSKAADLAGFDDIAGGIAKSSGFGDRA